MRRILILKHWQIMLVLLIWECAFVAIFNLLDIQSFTAAIFILRVVPITIYPLWVGMSLRKYIVQAHEKTERLFNAFILFAVVQAALVLAVELYSSELQMAEMNVSMRWLVAGMVIVNVVMIFKFAEFPAQALRSIELNRKAGFWEYIADSFQFVCWPLCIWWLQPRVNKINEKNMQTGHMSDAMVKED